MSIVEQVLEHLNTHFYGLNINRDNWGLLLATSLHYYLQLDKTGIPVMQKKNQVFLENIQAIQRWLKLQRLSAEKNNNNNSNSNNITVDLLDFLDHLITQGGMVCLLDLLLSSVVEQKLLLPDPKYLNPLSLVQEHKWQSPFSQTVFQHVYNEKQRRGLSLCRWFEFLPITVQYVNQLFASESDQSTTTIAETKLSVALEVLQCLFDLQQKLEPQVTNVQLDTINHSLKYLLTMQFEQQLVPANNNNSRVNNKGKKKKCTSCCRLSCCCTCCCSNKCTIM